MFARKEDRERERERAGGNKLKEGYWKKEYKNTKPGCERVSTSW